MSVVTQARVRQEILSRFNPIRGLTPDLLASRLDAFRVGYLRECAVTWDAMEERDINLKTVANKRKKAASRLQWDIVRVEGASEAEAERHETGLRYFYENLMATSVMEENQRGGVALLIRQMMDAIGKRYACHEIVWRPVSKAMPLVNADKGVGASERGSVALGNEAIVNPKLAIAARAAAGVERGALGASSVEENGSARGTNIAAGEDPNVGLASRAPLTSLLTAEFRFCPLWFFENRTGRLRFIPQAYGVEGIEMPDGDWLVTVGDGIMEACSVAYIYKSLSLKDWVSFSEKFGMPGVIGKTDAQKGSDQWNQMSDAVSSLMNDWAAVMNKNDLIELLEAKGGTGNLPFEPLVEYMDRKVAAIWRGADLSTISRGNADSSGASLQGEEQDLLLEDDAQLITETLNQQVDTFVIEYLFGAGVEPLAYFKLGTGREESDDAKFRREVWLGFLKDGTVNDVMANLTDLRELTKGVGIPLNEEYVEPYLPVHDQTGGLVTGEYFTNSRNHIVGGVSRPGVGAAGASERGALGASERGALENESAEAEAARLYLKSLPDFAKAVVHDLRPVVDRLGRILEITDPEIQRTRLSDFLTELPRLRLDISADPRAGHVLAMALSSALLNGFATGLRGPTPSYVAPPTTNEAPSAPGPTPSYSPPPPPPGAPPSAP